MIRAMRYLSVCSGIEAATMAWHGLGWEPVAFSEIERFPSAALAHHYPTVPNWGDMTKFKEWPDATVDVLCGGTPCQSFSVAGLRKGLADPRGNLMLTYLAIAERYQPKWVVWENVPGVFSSTTDDIPDPRPPEINLEGGDGPEDGFEVVVEDEHDGHETHALGCFLAGLSELGYGVAYRTLDAQFVRTCDHPRAVPQRRRRVFVVGYLGDWTRAAAVLFDRESLSGHPPPRREAGKRAAPTISARPTGGGGLGSAEADSCEAPTGLGTLRGRLAMSSVWGDEQPVLGKPLRMVRPRLDGGVICADIAPTLNAHFGDKQGLEDQHINGGCGLFVTHALRGEGFDASEDGTGRGTPIVPICFQGNASGANFNASFDLSMTLRAGANGCGNGPAIAIQERAASGGSSRSYVAQPWAVRRITPRECERLMGFPDDFTRIPYRGKPADQCPDGPRYKALGNSWAVPVARWVGERIAIVDTWSDTQ